jgi:hypothetical protein
MRPLREVLSREISFASLLERRSRELAIDRCVRAALPRTLAACTTVVDARSPELLLAATSGAAASLLRQRAPEIRSRLAGEGHEFTGIRIRVQAHAAAAAKEKRLAKQLDAATAEVLKTAARGLAGSPVAAALERLVRHSSAITSEGDESPAKRVENEDRQK